MYNFLVGMDTKFYALFIREHYTLLSAGNPYETSSLNTKFSSTFYKV